MVIATPVAVVYVRVHGRCDTVNADLDSAGLALNEGVLVVADKVFFAALLTSPTAW